MKKIRISKLQAFNFIFACSQILATTLILINLGCVKVSDKKSPNDSGTPSVQPAENSPQAAVPNNVANTGPIDLKDFRQHLMVQVIGDKTPQKYQVTFQWPEIIGEGYVEISSENLAQQTNVLDRKFVHVVDHDRTMHYSVTVFDANQNVVDTISLDADIPKDMIITTDNRDLTSDLKAELGRLYVSSEASLTTHGYDVDLSLHEIISDEGLIQTFAETAKADQGHGGRNGGSLKIQADVAHGHLQIVMRGEKGGTGLPALGYNDDDRGPAGTANGMGTCQLLDGSTTDKICTIGAPGTPGSQGAKGRTGGVGMRGGDTGSFEITIKDDSDLRFDPYFRPGYSGDGAPGSAGQLGGHPTCVSGPAPGPCNTQDGPQGPTGDTGLGGPDGVKNMSILKVGQPMRTIVF